MLRRKLSIGIDDGELSENVSQKDNCPPIVSPGSPAYSDQDAHTLLQAMTQDPDLLAPRLGLYVTYPKAEALLRKNSEAVGNLINGLWSEGFLLRNLQTVVYKCPHDGTISLRPKRLCPKCKSEDVEKVAMIEHLGPSHVDTEQRFLRNGQYVCPVCGKTLKLIGVDYRRATSAYRCLSCGALSPEPLRLWACNQSQHAFMEDEAVIEKVYNYSLNPEREIPDAKPAQPTAVAEEGDVFTRIEGFISGRSSRHDLLDPLVEAYKRRGYAVKLLCPVKGQSGALHMIDLYATKPPIGVMIWTFDGGEIDVDELSKLVVVQEDMKQTRTIVIAVPPMRRRVESLAKREGLTVVEGNDAEEVVEKIELLIEIDDLGQKVE